MASTKGSSNFRNMPYTGKQSLLPPKSPFPSIPPFYADYGSSSGTKGIPKPREGHRHHQRTSSESFLIEEQPSWVDELLDEPETPVRRGHRRSSSDSFAYVDAVNASNLDNLLQERYKWNLSNVPSRESQEFDHYKDLPQMSFYKEPNTFGKQQNRAWESSLGSVTYTTGLPSSSDNVLLQGSVSSCAPLESDVVPSLAIGKQNQEESCPHDPKSTLDRRDCPQIKPSPSESDQKRVKQQFAQRSRVRKLQYIAELERNVQALQAEGTEVSAELEFLDRQNLILNMENKTLKQRLDSLAQEQVIKYLEQEMLEREIARLRTLHQHQQQPPPSSSSSTSHRRSNSRDLDSQFANLSLKQKDAGSGHDPLHI